MRRVSTGLYLALILGGGIVSSALTGIAFASLSHLHELLYFSWAPSILSAVFFLVLLYKAWAAIQDGETPVSPGAAVGFSLIPLFNIYWMFVAIGGWGKHYNAFLVRNRVAATPVSEGLFKAFPICCVTLVGMPVAFVLGILVTAKMCAGINVIAASRS